MSLEQQLESIRSGKSKRLRGLEVKRDGSLYIIEGENLSLEEAVSHLNEIAAPKSGIDYDWTAFIEKYPGYNNHTSGIVKTHRVRDKAQHAELVEAVKARRNYLWYGKVIKNGVRYQVIAPLLIDFDTVPDQPYVEGANGKLEPAPPPPPNPKLWDGGLSCPFCNHAINSTSGRSLHVKSQHPEQLAEYFNMIRNNNLKPKQEENDCEDDVVSLVNNELRCQHCNKICTSTSGLTLHLRTHAAI